MRHAAIILWDDKSVAELNVPFFGKACDLVNIAVIQTAFGGLTAPPCFRRLAVLRDAEPVTPGELHFLGFVHLKPVGLPKCELFNAPVLTLDRYPVSAGGLHCCSFATFPAAS